MSIFIIFIQSLDGYRDQIQSVLLLIKDYENKFSIYSKSLYLQVYKAMYVFESFFVLKQIYLIDLHTSF